MPGDPGRALTLAQHLLTEPLMSNHARGLWGYTGQLPSPSGRDLTVQSTGIGAASGAVVLAELAGLGLRRAVRVGTCAALERPDGEAAPQIGDVLIAEKIVPLDGISSALAAEAGSQSGLLEPDGALTAALVGCVDGTPATLAGVDPVTPASLDERDPADAEVTGVAIATDLQVGALVAVGRRVGVAIGCVDLVVESADGSEVLDDEEIASRSIEIARSAVEALTTNP